MVRKGGARTRHPEIARQRSPLGAAAAIALLLGSPCSDALDQVTLEIGEISMPGGIQIASASAILDLSAGSPAARARVQQLQLSGTLGTYHDVEVICGEVVVAEPTFACRQGTASARGNLGSFSMRAAAQLTSTTGTTTFNGSDLLLAGGRLRFAGILRAGIWSATADASDIDLIAARKLAATWISLPGADSFNGHLTLRVEAAGRPGTTQLKLAARTGDLNFTNPQGSLVGQKLEVSLNGTAVRNGSGWISDLRLESSAGQTLAGPVLLDFAANPLSLSARARAGSDRALLIDSIQVEQKDLLRARAQARVSLGSQPALTQAHVDIERLQFPAAYRSLLQIALAPTDFGALITTGSASGELDIASHGLERARLSVQSLTFGDPQTRFSLANINGEMHWAADANAPVESSQLSWNSSSIYGLSAGPVRMSFIAHGMDFGLQGDTRFPVFDGALLVHTLAVRNLGSAHAELDFDADLEPISMSLLSKAFGWPALSGQLAGRIPAVTYRDQALSMQGDLTANVFDGIITGSGLRISDPLGPWPKLYANVTARRLDLDLVTHTFSIGSITGRLDADVKGLELFKWSPVAFDARLYSTPGDRSKRLISQKAVTSISNIGGGGGGVTAALQSGVLKFFDTFRYDRIGISCQLRDEVCLMSGAEPAHGGYYMVKGSGLPRIDIIGNAGRVDWRQLIAQIAAGMHSQNIIIR